MDKFPLMLEGRPAGELTAEREAAQGELDALYERWEQLSEEAGEA